MRRINTPSWWNQFLTELSDIIKQPWFFGSIDSNVARKILIKMELGSFLVRFSSNKEFLTLSVHSSIKTASHWRIYVNFFLYFK